MTDNKLETLHDKSTSYLEFNFNVSEELNPNQEIEVSARIHTSDWSKLLLSNDYSAVGDDSLPSNDYVLWQYMPVYKTGDNEEIIWGSEPEIDTNEIEPDLLVEFASLSSNGSNNMDLNIKITNIGVLPIDLGQTEIKYYYTNDKKIAQTINCDNVAIQSSTSYIDVGSKVISEIVKMPNRKKNADTYVSMRFSENTGILNFEDYIILKLRIENENGKYGNIIDNDYSNPKSIQKQDPQTFSDVARVALFTPNMEVNENIVIDSAYCNIFDNSFMDCHFGIEPNEPYEPTFSAFKVGWGSEEKYTNGDYQCFIERMEKCFHGVKYSDYAIGSNLENNFTFTQNNMNAILNSDVAYISGHGYFGGVVPISSMETGILGMFIANNNVKSSQFHINDHYKDLSEDILNNRFSFKENENGNIENSNLQWLIFGACAQLNDHMLQDDDGNDRTDIVFDGKYSYEYWLDTLLSNSNMKGILGYHKDAPVANFTRSDEDVIKRFLDYSKYQSVYEAWKKANAFKTYDLAFLDDTLSCALLTKDDYANQNFYDTIVDTSDVKGEVVYLYKSTFIRFGKIEYTESAVFNKNLNTTYVLNAVSEYAEHNDIDISSYTPSINEISRKIHNQGGECIGEELIEYTISFVKSNDNISMFAFDELGIEPNDKIVEIAFSYNPSTEEVKQL